MNSAGLQAPGLQRVPERVRPERAVETDRIRRAVAKRRIRVLASLLGVGEDVAADIAYLAAGLPRRTVHRESEPPAD